MEPPPGLEPGCEETSRYGSMQSVAETKTKGDLGVAMIISDAMKRGYKVAIPIGEDWRFDLIVMRRGNLDRVQCKYTESNGEFISVKCRSSNNWATYKYTSEDVDWIAVYDKTTERCYYIPSASFKSGRTALHLRLAPAKNKQGAGIRLAANYLDF